jgi:uncharacterized protein with ATP-grasp and redox domains
MALRTARTAGADEKQQLEAVNHAMALMHNRTPEDIQPKIAYRMLKYISEMMDEPDPYARMKDRDTKESLRLYPRVKRMVSSASDRLEYAVRAAIAGNVIDFAIGDEFDVAGTLNRCFQQPLAGDPISVVHEAISKAEHILYLADNAGETVFDRILIEELEQPVIYAVKDGPIFNDATLEDAIAAGIDDVAEIMSTGSDTQGTILDECSQVFRDLYEAADLIISKGMANYETLCDEDRPIIFLLKAKCIPIATNLGVEVGDIVLKCCV